MNHFKRQYIERNPNQNFKLGKYMKLKKNIINKNK